MSEPYLGCIWYTRDRLDVLSHPCERHLLLGAGNPDCMVHAFDEPNPHPSPSSSHPPDGDTSLAVPC
jgi:hypothetical protein